MFLGGRNCSSRPKVSRPEQFKAIERGNKECSGESLRITVPASHPAGGGKPDPASLPGAQTRPAAEPGTRDSPSLRPSGTQAWSRSWAQSSG